MNYSSCIALSTVVLITVLDLYIKLDSVQMSPLDLLSLHSRNKEVL